MKNKPLVIQAVTTPLFHAGDSLSDFAIENVEPSLVADGMILAMTSKIVSLSEGRLVDKTSISKVELIEREADHNLGEVGYGCFLTIKNGLFIPSAGIDESNSETDQYIIYPADPFLSAKKLWITLHERWNLDHLGILITDSHTTPLRRGVTGISLAHWGFRGLISLIGKPDLFGRKMKMTTVNVADALAAAVTLTMGEGSECRPLAVVSSPEVEFHEETDVAELQMPLQQDLYYPFFKNHIPGE